MTRLVAGRVGIVAVDAMIALAVPARKVPVAGHAPMGATPIVTGLRAVALGAQRQRIGGWNRFPMRRPQGVRALRVVTGAATQLTMLEGHARVKLPELPGRLGQRCWSALGMTTDARHPSRAAQGIFSSGGHRAQALRVNDDGPGRLARRRSELVHARRVRPIAGGGQREPHEGGGENERKTR